MQKIVIVALFCVTYVANGFAQQAETFQKVRLGVTASPHIAWMRFDDAKLKSDGLHFGGSYGLLIDVNLTKNYTVSTGIISSHTGGRARYDTMTSDANEPRHLRIQYIEVPFSFKLKTNQIGYLTYFAHIGFVPSIRTRARLTNDILGTASVASSGNITGYQMAFFDVPFQVGGGFEYAFSPRTSLYVAITFNNGLVDILKQGSNDKAVLRNVALRTGVFF